MDDNRLMEHNNMVNELCGCPGKSKTISNRVLKLNHEDWCFYYQYLSELSDTTLEVFNDDDYNNLE